MRETRVFCPTPLSGHEQVELKDHAARHINQVLRMQPGQNVVLFDGRGGEFPAVIESNTRSAVCLKTGDFRATEAESPLHLTLWHGLCRGERMDAVIQKATELGVQHIRPIITERSIVKIAADRAEKKLRHWQGVISSACEQCGRNLLPTIEPPAALGELLHGVGVYDLALLLDPRGDKALADCLQELPEQGQLLICTGPEGGFSTQEIAAALDAGMQAAHMGPRVLRTETAPVAALCMAQLVAGDMR